MVHSSVIVTPNEDRLLRAIERLAFGEFTNVLIEEQEPDDQVIDRLVTGKMWALLDIIRSGYRELDKIVVHQGEPTSVEFRADIDGFSAIQKRRL